MGKQNLRKSRHDNARILYRKSNTICTQSRTCSGTSQFYTRSGIFQYKKNFSQTIDYYIDGKIKRDLSIETDMCVLRRYYKNKKNRLNTRGGSNKSKFSSAITEKDIDKEFLHGACGDSKTMTKDSRQIDIAAVMIENLKRLLTNWIQKHLLEDKDTQDKIETVLHSILHKGKETNEGKVSSWSTYILSREGHNYEVKNKKMETDSLICDYCQHKSRPIAAKSSSHIKDLSCQSLPSPVKKLRVLSTLSIPRKHYLLKVKSQYKVKNIKCSVINPRKLLDSSSFDLLAISTRSFTKRFANYGMKKTKRRRIAFDSKPLYKNVSNTTKTEDKEDKSTYKELNKLELEDMTSLVKSIYAEHPANFTHPDHINRTLTNNTFTLTEKNNSKRLLLHTNKNVHTIDKYTCKASFSNILNEKDESEPIIDYLNQSVEFPLEREVKQNITRPEYHSPVNEDDKKYIYLTKKRRSLKLAKNRNIQNKRLMLSHKKEVNKSINSYELLKHIQSILEYITKEGGKRNFKLDVHVSLLPAKGKSVDASSHISNIAVLNNVVSLHTEMCNVKSRISVVSDEKQSTKTSLLDPTDNTPEIIALLDGATSQAKYIFNTENSLKSETIKTQTEDHGTKTSKLEMAQEIYDLKSVVKNLLHTAEILVSEQLKKEIDKRKMRSHKSNNVVIKTIETLKPPHKPISQGIQISNDFAKNLFLAGIKLSKEPKKDTIEFCHRLMRKSTSYKVIESESVLRVTDMTVGANTENFPEMNTSTLAKSKSIIDITKEKKKLMAYFCDGGCNNDSSCRQNNSVSFYKVSLDDIQPKKKRNNRTSSSCECSKNHTHQPVLIGSHELIPECPTSIYIDVDECCDKKSSIPTRKGMGFGEGFIYCILLWIPVTIIAGLFYNYVIKDLVYPSEHNVIGRSKNKTMAYLSDLGF